MRFLLLALLLLQAPAYAYVIGVSPASLEVCLGPGESRVANLTVSSNATVQIVLDIASNVSWAQTWSQIAVPAGGTAELPILFNASGMPEGQHSTKLFICAPEIPGDIIVRYCLGPDLRMTVSAACALSRPVNLWPAVVAIAAGFVAVLWYAKRK